MTISAETKEEKEEKEGERVDLLRAARGCGLQDLYPGKLEVDDTKAEAKHENGVLELTLPKKEGRQPRRIEVK